MTSARSTDQVVGPWSADAFGLLSEWDPAFATAGRAMSVNPWVGDVLPLRFVELVAAAVSIACTSLDPDSTRRHMAAALDAGATREELVTVVKMAGVMAIHSCSLGAPILLEEAGPQAIAPAQVPPPATPACDAMKAIGQWNAAWDPFFALDPVWTDQFMAAGATIYGSGVFSARETELLSIAFDASWTHMYAPGTRRHIKSALAAGATVAEIMEVLKICVACGIAAMNTGLPILADVLSERAGRS